MNEILDNEKLLKQIEDDIKIKPESILYDIEQQPYLLDRYSKLLLKRGRQLKGKLLEYDTMYAEKFKYYKEKYQVVLQYKDAEKYTSGCKEIVEMKREINKYESDIDVLKTTVDNLKQKYFSMKLLLDYKRYLSGDSV